MFQSVIDSCKTWYRETPLLYDWKIIDLTEVEQYPDGLKDMQNRKFDGMVIKNFLNQEEVKKMLDSFSSLESSEYIKTPGGGVYPPVFQQLLAIT
ncbi:MAG: hypothetical protein JKX84_07755, partial [Flavobacteriales bacterium]|nr:hypothetical protein [Flavobacteriales bacterium]